MTYKKVESYRAELENDYHFLDALSEAGRERERKKEKKLADHLEEKHYGEKYRIIDPWSTSFEIQCRLL